MPLPEEGPFLRIPSRVTAATRARSAYTAGVTLVSGGGSRGGGQTTTRSDHRASLAAIVACIEARLAAWLSAIAFITFVL